MFWKCFRVCRNLENVLKHNSKKNILRVRSRGANKVCEAERKSSKNWFLFAPIGAISRHTSETSMLKVVIRRLQFVTQWRRLSSFQCYLFYDKHGLSPKELKYLADLDLTWKHESLTIHIDFLIELKLGSSIYYPRVILVQNLQTSVEDKKFLLFRPVWDRWI